MASDIWLRTILIVRKETRCRHIGYSFQLAARVLLYASSHRQDDTYHVLCYTSRGALAGTRNSSMGPPHEGSIRRPITPWANALTTELYLAPCICRTPQIDRYPGSSLSLDPARRSLTVEHLLLVRSVVGWSLMIITHWAIFHSSQCTMTGLTKAVLSCL